jgi:hypothetical protein
MSIEKILEQTREAIEGGHWKVFGVPGESDDTPGIAYSVGFAETFDHAEVVLSGLPIEIGHRLVNDIGELIRNGRRFSHGDLSDEIVRNYNVPADVAENNFFVNDSVAPNRRYTMIQCVWPDKNGALPTKSDSKQRLYGSVSVN